MPNNTIIENAGVGLRAEHHPYILENRPDIPWFEVLSDNFMGQGGKALLALEQIRHNYPIALHSVGLSIGSTDPLCTNYLQSLNNLADRFEPAIVSDHLCWVSIDQQHLHDLLPLPFIEETLDHLIPRIEQAQEVLKRPLLFENLSSYYFYKADNIPEWEFFNRLCQKTGCGMLLDINNVYVSAKNHGFDAKQYIDGLALDLVKQIHLAGYTDMGDYLFDTHSQHVHPPVWDLYEYALSRFGPVPTLIEWDGDIPDFPRLQREAEKAQCFLVSADCYSRSRKSHKLGQQAKKSVSGTC